MELRNKKIVDMRRLRAPWGRRRIPIPQKTILRLIDMKLDERGQIDVVLIWHYYTKQEVVRGIFRHTQGTVPVDIAGNKLDLILQWISVGRPFRIIFLTVMRRMRVVRHFARWEIKAAMEERNVEVSKEKMFIDVSRGNQVQARNLLQCNSMLLRSQKRTGMGGMYEKQRRLIKLNMAAEGMMLDVCDGNDAMRMDAIMLWEILNKQEIIARMRRDQIISHVRAKQSKMMLILLWMKQGKPFGPNQRISSLIDLRRINRKVHQFIRRTRRMRRKQRIIQGKKKKLFKFI